MEAFTMAADKKNLVLHITRTLEIQSEDLVCESLPLGFLVLGVELCIRGVGLVDEAEVGCYLPHIQLLSVEIVLSVESTE
jgi:hypothetical protein